MTRSSLRLRLLSGAAAATFLALALAGVGFSWLFHRHVERREADGLIAVGKQIAASVSVDEFGRPIVDPLPANPGYQAVAGGRYWQVLGSGGSAQSASLWDQSLPSVAAPSSRWSSSTAPGPFEDRVLLVSRTIRPDAGRPGIVVRVARDDTPIRTALGEFNFEMGLSLALLWIVLSLAAYVQVGLGLRPLDRLRQEVDRLRRSPKARLSDRHPSEIAPLTDAINALAQTREDDLTRARRRAADLAHSLKTPLAVLSTQSRRARAAGAEGAADGLDRAIAAVGAALEAELARARAAATRASPLSGTSSALEVMEQLVDVVERTPHGEAIVFTIEAAANVMIPAEKADLAEMLGALIENAARHARRQVRITGVIVDDTALIRVEDDGPGMEESFAANAMQRGVRLDETGSGHGLGLSIVRDLAEATAGSLKLGRSSLGGLDARLSWTMASHPPKLR